jgi:predicted HTH transcriptional regulator
VVLLEIPAATGAPVAFNNIAYIRIGSATPKLTDYPQRYQQLIERMQPYRWEQGVARQYATGDDVLTLLDYSQYFRLTKQPLPDNRTGIFDKLEADRLIVRDVGDRWNITNLGAILFANRLGNFDASLARKGVRFVAYDRMIDLPPRSRNEALASLMRRMGFCEEQGSGLDKVIELVEVFQLPPPLFRADENSMQVVLYGPRSFAEMTPDERVRACYFHAVLKFLSGDKMKNASLCTRLGIDPKNASQATAVINKALSVGMIRVADPDHPRAGYVPHWA